MNQLEIDGAITNPIDPASLTALKDYAAAARKVEGGAPDAANSEVVAKSLA